MTIQELQSAIADYCGIKMPGLALLSNPAARKNKKVKQVGC